MDPAVLAGGLPHDKRLALPTEGKFTAPFSLGFPTQGSVMIESEGAEGDSAVQALEQVLQLQLLPVRLSQVLPKQQVVLPEV